MIDVTTVCLAIMTLCQISLTVLLPLYCDYQSVSMSVYMYIDQSFHKCVRWHLHYQDNFETIF